MGACLIVYEPGVTAAAFGFYMIYLDWYDIALLV
jgi:hypothetical protein